MQRQISLKGRNAMKSLLLTGAALALFVAGPVLAAPPAQKAAIGTWGVGV